MASSLRLCLLAEFLTATAPRLNRLRMLVLSDSLNFGLESPRPDVRCGSLAEKLKPSTSLPLCPQQETLLGTVRRSRKAQYRQIYSGRAFPLCPCHSDINLFG